MQFSIPSSFRRLLVTGGAGFIGSHVVDHLLAWGADRVVVLDDFNDYYDPWIKRRNVSKHANNPAFRLEAGDLRDPVRLNVLGSEEQFDCVIHLAARAGVRPSLTEARLYAEVNISGTLNVLEMARNHHCRHFIFASSSSVYGNGSPPPFKEDAPMRPISPYAATKAAGEMLVHTFSHLYGIRAVCLRFFTAYGPRQRPDLAIHKFAKAIQTRQTIPVFGDGSAMRDYTYIDDIVNGIAGAIRYCDEGDSTFEIVNLGESRCISLSELIRLLEAAIGEEALIERLPAQPGDMLLTHADISKARRLLSYQPSTAIETGIQNFVNWLQEGASIGVGA